MTGGETTINNFWKNIPHYPQWSKFVVTAIDRPACGVNFILSQLIELAIHEISKHNRIFKGDQDVSKFQILEAYKSVVAKITQLGRREKHLYGQSRILYEDNQGLQEGKECKS